MLIRALAFMVAFGASQPVLAQGDANRDSIVTVLGQGRYEMKPDTARFTATVVTEGRTLDEAGRAHQPRATRALAVMRDLESLGIVIEKTSFSIQEQRTQRPQTPEEVRLGVRPSPTITGYAGSTAYSLRANSLDNLNEAVTRLVDTGLLRVDTVRFAVSQERAALNQARRAAMTDALEQAHAYSEPVSLKLGRIVSITDGEARPPDGYADLPSRRAQGAHSVQIIPPAVLEFTASVNVTWRLDVP